jgi:hypothetical protein
MGTNTPNYQLFKPDPDDDNVDVADINNNSDIIDTELKEVSDATTLDRPIAQLRNTTVTSIPHNTFTAVVFQAEDKDSHNGHDAGGPNPTRYTCPTSQGGVYEISYMATFTARTSTGSTDIRAAQLRKNNTPIASSGNQIRALDNATTQPSVKAGPIYVQLAPTEYVELFAFQNSGTALDTYVATDYVQSYLNLKWIRAS